VLAAVGLVAVAVLVALALALAGDGRTGGEGRAVVWAVGDGGDGKPRSKELAVRIASAPLDRFLYLGDVYGRGTAEEFRRNYAPVYGRLAAKTSPTPGNRLAQPQ